MCPTEWGGIETPAPLCLCDGMADMLDSKSSVERRVGSTPTTSTKSRSSSDGRARALGA